jgi:hypothetical protein
MPGPAYVAVEGCVGWVGAYAHELDCELIFWVGWGVGHRLRTQSQRWFPTGSSSDFSPWFPSPSGVSSSSSGLTPPPCAHTQIQFALDPSRRPFAHLESPSLGTLAE